MVLKKLFLAIAISFSVAFVYAQSNTTLQEYTGIYRFPDGSVVTSVDITIQDGTLIANSTMGTAGLTRISRDTFSIPTYKGMAYFSRNAEGKIVKVRVQVQDLILDGDKQAGQMAWIRKQLLLARR